MITPGVYAGSQFFKIGDYVTFAWNYTSLSISPTAVDIMASCTVNQATYTVAVNQSIEATQTVVWDTGNYQNDHPNGQPFLTENYLLMIYDANSSASDTGKPGYLAPYKALRFGMYAPQPYTSWADFKCANCNGAISPMEMLTLKAMMVTSATTVASLLYFTASFGVW
ncbi:hypothetical protein P280DRAFT_185464 [Massarina eburnea CBS 473.64]|uniref:DUF7137 domain-containing protein n=1 Tax=Massarina eburnea CBS 473.64 TaxID=1395130 RepID=A0A6A6SFH9_9PLEO|nr:hypothetical protein P280DRAFT_185464 [Massarina eburnea CBS 473.64]